MTQTDGFVFLTLNGEDVGLYYQVEQIGKDFLERNQKAEGNLYADRFGDVAWSTRLDLINQVADWKKIAASPDSPENDYSDLKYLLEKIATNPTQGWDKLLGQIVNKDAFLAWNAHAILMGGTHQDNIHNLKLYMNPVNGKTEFIPDDERFDGEINKLNSACQTLDFSYNQFFDTLLAQPEWLLERNKIVWNYVANPEMIAEDYAFFDNLYETSKNAYRRGSRYSSVLQFEFASRNTLKLLQERYQLLKNMLSDPPRPRVTAARKPDLMQITVKTAGFTGFMIEKVAAVDGKNKNEFAQTKVNIRILPQLVKTEGNFCNSYKSEEHSFTLPLCADCQDKELILDIKNLTTGQSVLPEISYE